MSMNIRAFMFWFLLFCPKNCLILLTDLHSWAREKIRTFLRSGVYSTCKCSSHNEYVPYIICGLIVAAVLLRAQLYKMFYKNVVVGTDTTLEQPEDKFGKYVNSRSLIERKKKYFFLLYCSYKVTESGKITRAILWLSW